MGSYWYERLDPSLKSIYNHVYRGLELRETVINAKALPAQTAFNLYFKIHYDHPELFYLPNTVSYRTEGDRAYYEFVFLYDSREIRRRQSNIDRAIEEIKASADMSDEFSIVCHAAEYIARKTKYKIDNTHNQNASAALSEGIAQCSGYATALQLVLERLGLFCVMVIGDSTDSVGDGVGHAWNIVRINGKYYHLDVTYWDGINGNRSVFLFKDYLFYTDDMMDEDHVWEKSEYPRCVDDDLYHLFRSGKTKAPVRNKKVYSNKNDLKSDLITAIKNREKKLSFKIAFSDSDKKKLVDSYIRVAAIMAGVALDWEIKIGSECIVEIRYKK